jgi:arylsulfatase A-like enzyme
MCKLLNMMKLLIGVILTAFILVGCRSITMRKFESKPNIIYILADDLGYGDLSFLGQSKFQTPNIDKLAREGMVFTQHYSGSTVCAPSRSALLTGQHTGHTFIRGNKEYLPEGQYPLTDSIFTLAELLKQVGYVNGVFGKWGLGYPGSEGDPNMQGFDEFYGYNCQRIAHNYYPYHLWHNQKKVFLTGNKGMGTGDYAPRLIHNKAIEFIEQHKDTSFFLYYASALPHAELLIDSLFMAPFKDKLLPELAYVGYDEGEDYRNGPYGSQAECHAAFAAMVTLLDKQVGEIAEKVNQLGIAENTIIVFTSDNGPHEEGGADPDYFNSNGIFRGLKRDLYEGGIRVPMIVKWQGKVQAGSKTDHISAFWDVMPTCAEITQSQSPINLDGISFLPTLLGDGYQRKHEYLYWEFHEKGGRQAVRKGKWKAVWYNVRKGDNSIELYDLDVDPGEQNNVATQFPAMVKEMEALIKEARTESSVFKFESKTYLQNN